MKCPNDQTTLLISERQNIEIDYCPECRGIWLDRGELDKLIEKDRPGSPEQTNYRTEAPSPQNHHQSNDSKHRPKKKRRESFLEDIFDF